MPGPESELAAELLLWWDSGHADLPWRRVNDPYAIWIAEVMLQQTQIATVIPYYERWMARFATAAELAKAPLDEVLKEWQGLGYYSRVRNLHAAAKLIVQELNGKMPETVDGLLRLPGIGRYTAGAIASIAFDTAVPVLDGNVIRVLSRLYDLEADVTKAATQRDLWSTAARLVPAARAGDYNQAMMELGQLICTPVAPECAACPLALRCLARQRGTQYERPVRPARKRTPHYDVVAGVIWQTDPSLTSRFLIAKRPLDGMLGGLWEFPGGKVIPGERYEDALVREIKEELAITIRVDEPLCMVRHAYTHFRISLYAFCARYKEGDPQHIGVADHAWVSMNALESYPFAVTDLKIIAALKHALL